jgi:uncharacterized membrane protein YfcA
LDATTLELASMDPDGQVAASGPAIANGGTAGGSADSLGAPPGSRSRRVSLSLRQVLAIGIVGGAMSGLLGVGGGTVMVPLLALWAGLSQRDAHAVSLGAIIPISLVGALTYGLAGEIRPEYAVALAIGSTVGARVGTDLLARASDHLLKLWFGAFLLVVAVTMVVK